MSKQEMVLWSLSLVAASFALRERAELDASRARFEATFPDDAAMLVVDTLGEVLEVAL